MLATLGGKTISEEDAAIGQIRELKSVLAGAALHLPQSASGIGSSREEFQGRNGDSGGRV